MELLENFPGIPPSSFLSMTLVSKKRRIVFPDISALLGQESFGELSLHSREGGLEFHIDVRQPFQESIYPQITQGDSLEIFLDTRDLKSVKSPGRFCHHFFALASPVLGVHAAELALARKDDSHPLCDPEELNVRTHFKRSGYTLTLFIPASCLHGYDPRNFPRLGLAYRLNRKGGLCQDFPLSSKVYPLSRLPHLWASLILT